MFCTRNVIIKKAGETPPSVKPSRNRTAVKPLKLLGAAKQPVMIPQVITVQPTVLEMGRRLMM